MPDSEMKVYPREIDAVARSIQMRDYILARGENVARRARGKAPIDTGQGAGSIHAETVLAETWEALISWDRDHYYMGFQDQGTRSLPARPFLVPALHEEANA